MVKQSIVSHAMEYFQKWKSDRVFLGNKVNEKLILMSILKGGSFRNEDSLVASSSQEWGVGCASKRVTCEWSFW